MTGRFARALTHHNADRSSGACYTRLRGPGALALVLTPPNKKTGTQQHRWRRISTSAEGQTSPDPIQSLHSSVNLPATEAMSPASPSTPEPDYSWREMAPKMHGQPAQKAALPKVPCQSIKQVPSPSATQATKGKGCGVKTALWINGLCFECDRAVKACVVLIAP